MADDRDRAEIAEDNGCTIQQEDSKEISHDADQESKNTFEVIGVVNNKIQQ